MLKHIDYNVLEKELKQIMNTDDHNDKLECAYHYGHFGFNAYSIKYLEEAQYQDENAKLKHKVHLDSIYTITENCYGLEVNDFSQIKRGNCNFLESEEFEIVFEGYESNARESGIYIQLLPYIEIIKSRSNVKNIKINCNERLRELFELYFPYIEIGSCKNKVNSHEIVEYVYNIGGSSLLRNSINNISKRLRNNRNKTFLGINWFANTIYDRYRSIPIGVLINTVGSNAKKLKVKSFQYNDPKIEIEIYNRYSKNKIVETFNNDINTSIVEILDAVSECYCFVGIQSEASVIAYSLCGIPTIVTSSSSHFYWYFLNGINPYLNTIRMRFAGDYDYITKGINKLL
jgi:hypothetical protein